MQYTPAASPFLHRAASDVHASAASLQQGKQDSTELATAWNSNDLLQGQKAVAISHNGSVYRLQSTKLGKLILTK